jgi:hypothetical protein
MNARELSNRLAELLQKERHALAAFLIALAEFDRVRGWVDLGHNSLFNYLHNELGVSRGAAHYRATAAQLIQRHPEVVEPLRDGRLCFTSILELSKVATADNIGAVLPRFFHLSKSEAKEVSAELNPTPAPVRIVITAVRALAPEPALKLSVVRAEPSATVLAPVDLGQKVHPDELASAPRTPVMTVEPKTAEQSRVHITVPRRLLQKLEAARDALSHSHPGASEVEILEVGLDLVLQRHAKRRGIGAKPRATPSKNEAAATPAQLPSTERSRRVPAAVWRGVWERDHGCCAWPLENGGVCGSTRQLELDHIKGWALGAETTVHECRILCRFHQDVSARQLYGDDLMNNYTRPKGGSCSEPVAAYRPSTGESARGTIGALTPPASGSRAGRPRSRFRGADRGAAPRTPPPGHGFCCRRRAARRARRARGAARCRPARPAR